MGEIPKAQGRAAQVLEASIDRLRRSVGCAGAVEVREDVGLAVVQGAAELSQLDQCGRDAGA